MASVRPLHTTAHGARRTALIRVFLYNFFDNGSIQFINTFNDKASLVKKVFFKSKNC